MTAVMDLIVSLWIKRLSITVNAWRLKLEAFHHFEKTINGKKVKFCRFWLFDTTLLVAQTECHKSINGVSKFRANFRDVIFENVVAHGLRGFVGCVGSIRRSVFQHINIYFGHHLEQRIVLIVTAKCFSKFPYYGEDIAFQTFLIATKLSFYNRIVKCNFLVWVLEQP